MKKDIDYTYYDYKGVRKHAQMSLSERAAQFAPFAALTGYDDAIKEEKRLTEEKPILLDDEKEAINEKLNTLISSKLYADFIFFSPDAKKQGGSYITKHGKVKKIDLVSSRIILEDGSKIEIENIIDIKLKKPSQ